MKKSLLQFVFITGAILACSGSLAQEPGELTGWWDLKVEAGDQTYAGWLEVKKSGVSTLVGRVMVITGSARPISEIHFENGHFSFSIPPQWLRPQDLFVSGKLDGDRLEGNLLTPAGSSHRFTGSRAPELLYPPPTKWSKPRPLLKKNSLEGWVPLSTTSENQWVVREGVLHSPASGVNLRTEEEFMDFVLHIEFRYPEGSNSGVYLRGRYEVQVEDSYGKEPDSHYLGGVYGLLMPNENVAKKAGQWQSYDITLVGRRVTVVANGKTIIHNQIIPGVTGGALDSEEAAPGPIYLQGDHGPVEYRNITIAMPAN